MKIALTVKGAGLGAWLDDSFALCNQVMVVDDNNHFTSWLNPYKDAQDDSELALANAIIDEQVDVLITSQISIADVNKMTEAGVKVVIKNGGTVFDLVDEARTL